MVLDRLAAVRPRTLLIGAAVTLVGGGILFGVWPLPQAEALGGGPVLDVRGFSAGTDAAAYIDALGDEGRRLYAIMLVGDMMWTVVHGLTIAAAIAVGIRRSALSDGLMALAVLPLVGAALDIVENSSFLAAITAHPDPPPMPAVIMNVVTGSKLVILAVVYLTLIVALLGWRRTSARSDA